MPSLWVTAQVSRGIRVQQRRVETVVLIQYDAVSFEVHGMNKLVVAKFPRHAREITIWIAIW